MASDHHITIDGRRWLLRFTRLRGDAMGWTFFDHAKSPRILIDDRLRGGQKLETVLHEIAHAVLGSAIAAGLTMVGVTEERVKKLVGGDCGCKARQNKLDAVGEGVSQAVERGLNGALSAVLPFPVTDADVAAVAQAIAESPLTNKGLKDRAAGR